MRTELAEQYYNSMEYTTKLRERLSLIEDCKANPIFRQRRIQEVWSKDPIVFIEDILLLKIPDLHNAIKPFFLFESLMRELLNMKRLVEPLTLMKLGLSEDKQATFALWILIHSFSC